MPKTGAPTSKFRVLINGTIEDVWQEITRTDAPIAAFFNSTMHVARLAPGSKLAMRTPDGKYTGVVGEITEFDPPRRFAHTFKFTNYDDPPAASSTTSRSCPAAFSSRSRSTSFRSGRRRRSRWSRAAR